MIDTPIPVICEPILKTKPWGGRTLETLFDKALPPGAPIGESWELSGLVSDTSHVANGPLEGTSLSRLVEAWGEKLLGQVPLVDGQFPLLIKFLDARDNLSVQVHPKPTDAPDAPAVKHEAWYVLAADPGAEMYIGLKSGVTEADVAQASNTSAFADLLQRWPVKRGDCFYLPSGTVHAIGKGILVAEVQTPSDVTYRFYDWDRMGLDGKPRPLHVEEAIANTRYDVCDTEIVQPKHSASGTFPDMMRVTTCERFTISHTTFTADTLQELKPGEMCIWMILKGTGQFTRAEWSGQFSQGDTILIPAACEGTFAEMTSAGELLEVRIPQ